MHTFAVGNALLGFYEFIVLSTPPNWHVVVRPMASEVFAHVTKGDRKWVRDGEVSHLFLSDEGAYLVDIKIKPGHKRKLSSDKSFQLSTHTAYYLIEEKKKEKILKIEIYCEETNRTLNISIKGIRIPENLIEYLKYSVCH